MTGGYDDGYRACPCFWGTEPASFLQNLLEVERDVTDWHVLDVGCGEGKNALFLANRGADVDAMDISPYAVANARQLCGNNPRIHLRIGDIREVGLTDSYELVIAYGLLHCLDSAVEVSKVITKLQSATVPGGYNVLCAFNDGRQDLRAHPGFHPLLLSHSTLVSYYSDWDVVTATSTILREVHPHNNIEHEHSLTRLCARKREV